VKKILLDAVREVADGHPAQDAWARCKLSRHWKRFIDRFFRLEIL
jgi:hypothetical protein